MCINLQPHYTCLKLFSLLSVKLKSFKKTSLVIWIKQNKYIQNNIFSSLELWAIMIGTQKIQKEELLVQKIVNAVVGICLGLIEGVALIENYIIII